MTVPEEAVEAAAKGMAQFEDWEHIPDEKKAHLRRSAKRALEAAAPYMLADLAKSILQGMEAWAGDKEIGFLEGLIEAAAEDHNPYRSQA